MPGLTHFPSLQRWEDPWEAGLDLTKLRGKAEQFRRVRTLAEDPRHEDAPPLVDRGGIERLIAELELELAEAARLADDAALIWEWFLSPQLQAQVGLGKDSVWRKLESAAGSARQFCQELEPIAVETEHLFQAMPTSLNVSEESDLLDLVRRVGEFRRDADRSLDFLNPSGRQFDSRRNTALALAAWAVEDATGQQVQVSRGRASCAGPHFKNPAGKFVAALLKMIGGWNEPVLVGAFEKLRRPCRAKQPPSFSEPIVAQEVPPEM